MDLISNLSTQEKAKNHGLQSTNDNGSNPLRPTDQTSISTKNALSTSEKEKGNVRSISSTATPSTNDLDSSSRKNALDVNPQGDTHSSPYNLEGNERKTTYTAEEGKKNKKLYQEVEETSRKVSSHEQVQHTNTNITNEQVQHTNTNITNKVGTADTFKEKKCLEKEPSSTFSSSEQLSGQPQSSSLDLAGENDQVKVREDCTKTLGAETEEKPSSKSQSTHTTLSAFDNPTQSTNSQTQSNVFIPSFGANTNETANHSYSNEQTPNFMFPTGLPMKRSFDHTMEKPLSIIEQTLEEFKKPNKVKSNNEFKRHDTRMRKLLHKAISSDALKKKQQANEQNCQSDHEIFLI